MGGWRLESVKMLGYLLFPIGAYVYFNRPSFYEDALMQTMESVSRDVNFDDLARFENLNARQEIDVLGSTIAELEDTKTATTTSATNSAASTTPTKMYELSPRSIASLALKSSDSSNSGTNNTK